jgi:hypothetical protein
MRTSFLALFAVICLAGGCTAPASPDQPTAAGMWIRDADEFLRQWDAAIRVLKQHRFRPDRQDTRAGVITTQPQVTGQVWEVWRRDCYVPYYQSEADLHTIRRIARVEFERRSEVGEYQVRVFVDVERLSMPERAVMLASGAMNMYGTAMPTTTGRTIGPQSDAYWVSLGRDAVLERRLLAEMTRGRREIAADLEPPPVAPPVPDAEPAQPEPEPPAMEEAPAATTD